MPTAAALVAAGTGDALSPPATSASQPLDPRRTAEPGSHVTKAVPEPHARAQQKRPNRRRAERELVGELPVAEPADLAQEEGFSLRRRHPLDLVPHGCELSRAQDMH
jgi:hypothetical protein